MLKDEQRHRVRVRNTSQAIKGTLCDCCDWLEVLTRRYRFHEEERYYCDKGGFTVDPHAMTEKQCQKIRELRRSSL